MAKLDETCTHVLRQPTAEERQLAEFAADMIKDRNRNFYFLCPILFCLVGLPLFLLFQQEKEYQYLIVILGGLWLLLVTLLMHSIIQDIRLAEAIREGKYSVANGTCLYSSVNGHSIPKVYGAVGETALPNLVFSVDWEVIKAMPRRGWGFLLISSSKQANIVMVAPDGELLLAESIESKWSRYID